MTKMILTYAIGRTVFGAAALVAPERLGRALAGPGGAVPDAQAFLRGIGGRELGLGVGLLATLRVGGDTRPWLLAGVCADAGDMAGMFGAWSHIPPAKRAPGLAFAGAAAAMGLGLGARARRG